MNEHTPSLPAQEAWIADQAERMISGIENYLEYEGCSSEEHDKMVDFMAADTEAFLHAYNETDRPIGSIDQELYRLLEHEQARENREQKIADVMRRLQEKYPHSCTDTLGSDMADVIRENTQGEIEVDGKEVLECEIARAIAQIGEDVSNRLPTEELMNRKYALAARLYDLYGEGVGGRLVPIIDIVARKGIVVNRLNPDSIAMVDILNNGVSLAVNEQCTAIADHVIEQIRPEIAEAVEKLVRGNKEKTTELVDFILFLGGAPASHEVVQRFDPGSVMIPEKNEMFYRRYEELYDAYVRTLNSYNLAPDHQVLLTQYIHSVHDEIEKQIVEYIARTKLS